MLSVAPPSAAALYDRYLSCCPTRQGGHIHHLERGGPNALVLLCVAVFSTGCVAVSLAPSRSESLLEYLHLEWAPPPAA